MKVIVNGYDGLPSIKSAEDDRRARVNTSVDITIDQNMPTPTPQDDCLSRGENKTRIIQELITVPSDSGVMVEQVVTEADQVTVTTSIEAAFNNIHPAVIVGTDTDMLVMPITRSKGNTNIIILFQGTLLTLH